jgi:hypothetical protein
MALINPTPTVDPAVQTVQAIKTAIASQFQPILTTYLQNYNAVWRNPKVAPNLVVAQMGVDAQQLFTVAAMTAQLLVALGCNSPGYPVVPTTMPTGWNFVANPDGSVTLTKATI